MHVYKQFNWSLLVGFLIQSRIPCQIFSSCEKKNGDPHFKISLQEKTQFLFKRKEKVRSQNILVVNRRQYSCDPNNRHLNTGNILIRKTPKSQTCANYSDGRLPGYNYFLTILENAILEKSWKNFKALALLMTMCAFYVHLWLIQ